MVTQFYTYVDKATYSFESITNLDQIAADCGQLDVCEFLVNEGADPCVTNKYVSLKACDDRMSLMQYKDWTGLPGTYAYRYSRLTLFVVQHSRSSNSYDV